MRDTVGGLEGQRDGSPFFVSATIHGTAQAATANDRFTEKIEHVTRL